MAVEVKMSQGQILFNRVASEYQESDECADGDDSKCNNIRVAPEKKSRGDSTEGAHLADRIIKIFKMGLEGWIESNWEQVWEGG